MLDFLKKGYAVEIEDDEEYIDITETDWHKEMKVKRTPGKAVRIENRMAIG